MFILKAKNLEMINMEKILYMKISDIIAIVGGLASLLLYGYLTFQLNYMEKRLLAIKTRAYLFLSTVGITLLAIILLLITSIIEKDKTIKIFIIIITVIYTLLGAYFSYQIIKDSKRKSIYFEYKDSTYKFLNRIDDSTISALPDDTHDSSNKIYLISLTKLDLTEFYTKSNQQDNKKQQQEIIINKLNEIINLVKKTN